MTEAAKQEPEFRLEKADLQSPTWLKLKKHMEAQLEKLRRKNDNDLSPDETAKLRGRVQVFKNLLALGEPGPGLMVADEEQGE